MNALTTLDSTLPWCMEIVVTGCLVQSLDQHVHPISLLWMSFYVGNKLKHLINEATVLCKMDHVTRTSAGSDTTIPVKMFLTEFKAGLATLDSLQWQYKFLIC